MRVIFGLMLASTALSPAALAQTAAEEQQGLEEIVVTAQKREQSQKDVPISMSVLNADLIAESRTQELRDISRLVPNFSIQRQGAIDTVFIRGVGGGGRNVGFTTRAGVYVDGVYAGQFASINQDALDIERIEVLRGPQGQLFGRNTVSGAVSIVSAQPTGDLVGYVEAGYGNKDLIEVKGMINLPLAGDKVALRLSASHRERDGFTINLPTDSDLDNLNRDTGRAQLRADLSDTVRLDLSADYSRDKTNKAVGEAITDTFGTGPSPAPGAFDTPYNRIPLQDIEIAGGSATLNFELSDTTTLTAISGYRWTDWVRSNDLDYIPLDFFGFDFNDSFRQFSQELRIGFGGDGPLTGVAGLYYFDEKAESRRVASAGTDTGFLPFGFVPGPIAAVNATVKSRSIAAFASVDWKLAPSVTVNLGGRFTSEKLKLRDYSTFGPVIFALATIPDFDDKRSESSFDPTIGVTFAASDAVNIYAKYARGFKSGGWNVDFVSVAQFADGIDFTNESVNSFEAGLKAETPDRVLRFNLAGFYTSYNDYQINQFVDLGGGQTSIQLRNAAKVKSWGFEASAQAAPSDGLTLGGDIGYTNAKFDRFPNGGGPGVDLDDRRLPYAPRFTASANAGYSVPIDALGGTLRLSANWSYRSGSFSGAENIATQKIDSRHLVDGRVEVVGDASKWSVALWVRNLFDADYVDNRILDFFQTQLIERGEPRTFGISARIGF
jgi:iron complex outermembrane recepter protein